MPWDEIPKFHSSTDCCGGCLWEYLWEFHYCAGVFAGPFAGLFAGVPLVGKARLHKKESLGAEFLNK